MLVALAVTFCEARSAKARSRRQDMELEIDHVTKKEATKRAVEQVRDLQKMMLAKRKRAPSEDTPRELFQRVRLAGLKWNGKVVTVKTIVTGFTEGCLDANLHSLLSLKVSGHIFANYTHNIFKCLRNLDWNFKQWLKYYLMCSVHFKSDDVHGASFSMTAYELIFEGTKPTH